MKKIFLFTLLTLLSATSVGALTPAFNSGVACPASEQITQNLRSGAYNGNYHSYTRGTVTQAHLLQRHLNRLGFSSGYEDGKLGPISTGAIQRMQSFLGEKPDGIVGPLTRFSLNNSCEPADYPVPCGIDAPGCILPSGIGATIQYQSVSSASVDYATIQAQILMNQSNSANVYFLYGTSNSRLERATEENSFADISESGSRLQKLFIDTSYSNSVFSKQILNLDEDEEYYFTACIDSDEKSFTCSSDIKSFETGIFNNPDVQTNSVLLDNLGAHGQAGQLIFEGHSEHNDATNVKTFFVYGPNTKSLNIDGNYDSYNDINTNSGMKKTNYSNSPDSGSASTFNKSITPEIEDLNQPNYFSACIEYRDEDDDTRLECGNPRLFDYSDTIENAERQARDAAVKAAVSARRSDIYLYNVDNGTYDNAFPYITNLQLNTGNSYSLIYQSKNTTYTQYTALQSRNDLFCTDSTGYAGYTSSVLFGISCNH
jgi:peptidoglycan hydrolase-like protein with peptidoglycan-binding domain